MPKVGDFIESRGDFFRVTWVQPSGFWASDGQLEFYFYSDPKRSGWVLVTQKEQNTEIVL